MFSKRVFKNIVIFSRKSYSTVDQKEMKHFEQYSGGWWNTNGEFKPLHAMNKLRIPFIRNALVQLNSNHNGSLTKPLQGLSILDIGCGGGILSEPLARLGATVTGLDANAKLIEIAEKRNKLQNLSNITYVTSPIEDHAAQYPAKYDAVVASEILEHVNEKEDFVKCCVQCLKTRGSIFFTTVNKTFLANLLGIIVAEQVLKIVPEDTHEYEKFCEPYKLDRMLLDNNCRTLSINGMNYNWLTNNWFWMDSQQLSYALHAVKFESNEQ